MPATGATSTPPYSSAREDVYLSDFLEEWLERSMELAIRLRGFGSLCVWWNINGGTVWALFAACWAWGGVTGGGIMITFDNNLSASCAMVGLARSN